MVLETRHAGHDHSSNLKYGYIIFGASLLSALVLGLSYCVWLQKWRKHGVPNHRSVWARLGSPSPAWLHVLIWVVITLGLSFYKVHDLKEDYVTVAKRFGRVGFYLVPFDILLALRPSLLSTSYLEYIQIHKWISRYIVFLTTMHGVGFFYRWISKGQLWAKSFKILNFIGIVVFFASLILALISIRPIRRRAYKAFYLIHNITIASFMILIVFHARPGVTDATLISVLMLIFQTYQRVTKSYRVSKIKVEDSKLSGLRLLRLPKPSGFPTEWSAGAHTRLSFPLSNFKSWLFPSHPYTIVSLPGDHTVDLIIKKSHEFQVDAARDYTITAPYASLSMPFFETAERVVIICAGSGISLGIPIFRYFNANASVHSELHWCIPSKSDCHVLGNSNLGHKIDVYITGNRLAASEEDEAIDPSDTVSSRGRLIELDSLQREAEDSLRLDSDSKYERKNEKDEMIQFKSGRPVLDTVFSSLLEGQDLRNSWIVVCGPNSMILNAKNWGKDHGINVFSELYEF